MNYKIIIVSLLCVFMLCSPVYAGNGNGNGHAYGQQFTEAVGNTTIKMSDGIDGSRYEVKKNNRHIRIELKEEKNVLKRFFKSDDEYHTQTVQIPYHELEALEDFNGLVKIDHYTDEGIKDDTIIKYVENVNGYAYLDLEFSTVYITPYISKVYNWDFEEWEPGNTVPVGWIENAEGTQRGAEAKINNYSIDFNGTGNLSTPVNAILINNFSTTEDYTALVNVSLPSGTDSDFSNIRFKNVSGSYVPYWIENKSDGNYANIWFRLSKSESTVVIDNAASPAVSESNGAAVFYSSSYHVSTDTDERAPFDVINGGLETLTDWTISGATLSTDKQQGTYSYELYVIGSPTGEYFEQYIDVPNWDDDVYIHFWAMGFNPQPYGYHNYFYVDGIETTNIPSGGWVEYYVNLSSYKGQNIPIKFRVYTSNTNPDNGAAGRYDDIFLTNSSSGTIYKKIRVSPAPTFTQTAGVIETPGNYTVGAWVKTENVESGNLHIKINGSTGISVSSQVNEWTWYESREYIPTGGNVVLLYVDSVPNAEASFYVDGLIVSEDYNTTATEEDADRTIYQNITYTPGEVYDNSVYVTEYTDFDIYGHGKYNTSVYIDSVSADFWLADGMIYIETSGITDEAHDISIKTAYNLPPILYYPVDGSTLNKTFPPLNNEITFKFEDSGTQNQGQVATDINFQNIVFSGESQTNSTTVSLPAGVYYWRVRTYDPVYSVYSEYSDINTFTINAQPVFPGTGINGVVYNVETGTALSNAIVQIYNDTWSGEPYITAGDGYYYFPDLVNSTTYAVYATKTAYENSNIYYVTTTADEYKIKNIPMQSEEGAGIYYEKHYVSFTVRDRALNTYPATVAVFVGDNTESVYTQVAGSDGAVGFWLDQKTRYRIETTYDGQTQIDYITPTEEEYNIFLEWLDEEQTFLPENQFNDDINITITSDTDTGQVVIYYTDSLAQTETLKFQIGQTENNGTYTVLDESTTYTGVSEKIQPFTLTDFVGKDYRIKVIITHGSFGSVTRDYGVSFPGSNLPFGKPISYLCVFILFIVGMQFSAKDADTGAVLICGFASLMWYLDLFKPFGDGANTLIGVGIGAAVFYAILAYINSKRVNEAI